MRKSHSGSRDESSGNLRPELIALLRQLKEDTKDDKTIIKILDDLWKEGKGRGALFASSCLDRSARPAPHCPSLPR